MRSVLVDGMHGLGDNVHQRGVIRRLLAAADLEVWLKTPWPCLYHDLVGERLHLIPHGRTLRTQAKNTKREAGRYSNTLPPFGSSNLRVWYSPASMRATGSIFGAMIRTTLGQEFEGADFTLPVPPEWRAKAAARIARPDRPMMVLRPLVDRREWDGCTTRNPDPDAYAALFNAVRRHFFVVSIADLVAGQEWLVGPRLPADVTLHAGELDAEGIAGLIASAAVTFCSPGFAIPLSQAVGTPVVAVFGGRESSRFYQYGSRFAPTLGIDPVKPCDCLLPRHKCNKRINLPLALARLASFLKGLANAPANSAVIARGSADQLGRAPEPLHESGRA